MQDIQKEWEALTQSDRKGYPLLFSAPPVYGIWNGRGWMETTHGLVFQCYSPNGLKAVMLRWSEGEKAGLQIREIGPDGLPVPEDDQDK